MPNNYFQFKQFKIEQDASAMKVTTEGCLFGALINPRETPVRILDIGTGTGLLSLMLVQRYPNATIDAIEIDENACIQALNNFRQSPWFQHLRAHHSRIQDYRTDLKYDLIISNPPFFKSSIKGKSQIDNQAKHETELNQSELIESVNRLLDKNSELWVIYPPEEANQFDKLAKAHAYHSGSKILISDRPESKVLRVVQQFSRLTLDRVENTLYIKSDSGYSEAFVQLLKDYYLHL